MIRSFVAVPLPKATRDALEAATAGLDIGRLVPPENLHITLAYLDKQTPQTLERIDEVLSQMRVATFEVTIAGIGIFGGKAPRAIWAGVAPSLQLETLRDKVRNAAQRSDVVLARERFRPHVTLTRLKKSQSVQTASRVQSFLSAHGDLSLPPFNVEKFTLFRSTLHAAGSIYDPMVDYALM